MKIEVAFYTSMVVAATCATLREEAREILQHAETTTSEDFSMVIKSHLNEARTVMYHSDSSNTQIPDIISRIHTMTSKLTILTHGGKFQRNYVRSVHIPKIDLYLLLIHCCEDNTIDQVIQKMAVQSCWSPTAKFFIIYFGEKSADWELIFKRLLKYQIINIALLHIAQKGSLNKIVKVVTYNPFKTEGKIDDHSKTWFNNSTNMFENKLTDLNGYILRVSMFNFPPNAIRQEDTLSGEVTYGGYDGTMIKTLAHHLNATINFILPDDGYTFGARLPNGTITGSSGHAFYGVADIAANSRYMKSDWAYVVSYLYPHDMDDMCVVVPKSQLVERYKNLMLPFTKKAWEYIACSIPIASFSRLILSLLVGGNTRRRRIFRNMTSSFFKTYSEFLSIPLPKLEILESDRIFEIFWVFFSLIITSLYQGSLASYLVLPKYLPDINTLQQLDESGLGIYIYPGIDSYIKIDESNSLLVNLAEKLEIGDEDLSVICDNIVRLGNISGIMDYHSAKYYISLPKYRKNEYPLLHLMSECVMPAYVVYEVPLESLFLHRFNTLVQRMVEGGLFGKWHKDTILRKILGENLQVDANKTHPKILSLSHLQSAFYLLLLGLSFSLLVIIGELIIKFHKKTAFVSN
ncbi:ionotropic receptor 93a isoform X2 [Anabrus simplex]